ncbi:potassium transporter Kup [Thiothrix lacustris]|uniref:Probable potassium transport system protein Kup n=1 Tax=Thiothrix lacustris TaxID=525917 RepID=A0ABY9MRR0_9GAMM|nr:potassium transporter Kup [Thiothrix lacustris]WML90065.1 potassium transporter Kup [Thiothrix lacustris]
MSTIHAPKQKLGVLMIAALGVVFGDIGTSPLYAFKEAFLHGLTPTHENVLAILSAIFWSVTMVISVKYVWLVLRFDNKGEGGELALLALARRHTRRTLPRWSKVGAILGVFAAALFYGDAVITPAISVLSAVEGISVATPQFEHLIIPITLGILISLFMIQRFGTAKVGSLFGPITLVWFASLAILGLISIIKTPQVLQALNPLLALSFTLQHPAAAFVLLSAVFLALTGGEAMYTDMGHFGARPIRLAWYGLVWPSLMLNYFGQGALVIRHPEATENPFYFLAPEGLLIPLVILATMATVIASQATISGAYSLTRQATRLGYLPRIRVEHTSDSESGQIYIASVNWLMLLGVLLLVLSFGSSSALAAAYGVAVSGAMVINSLMVILVALARPNQRIRHMIVGTVLVCSLFEIMFFASNLSKIEHGGWLPITMGIVIFTLLMTWKKGSQLVADHRRKLNITMRKFITDQHSDIPRVPGTAVYLASNPNLVPSRLFYNIKHYGVMHQQIVFLHVDNEEVPYVEEEDRLRVTGLAPGIYSVGVRFGFREDPDLTKALRGTVDYQLELPTDSTTFFVARTALVGCEGVLPYWRCALFGWMMRQSESAASYFNLPPEQVVEIGTQVSL